MLLTQHPVSSIWEESSCDRTLAIWDCARSYSHYPSRSICRCLFAVSPGWSAKPLIWRSIWTILTFSLYRARLSGRYGRKRKMDCKEQRATRRRSERCSFPKSDPQPRESPVSHCTPYSTNGKRNWWREWGPPMPCVRNSEEKNEWNACQTFAVEKLWADNLYYLEMVRKGSGFQTGCSFVRRPVSVEK